jgi:hypothetical protein
MNVLNEALKYQALGFSAIPLSANAKIPEKGFTWKQYTERHPTNGELYAWFGKAAPVRNIAILTGEISNLVVLDFESREDAAWAWKELGASTTCISVTRRGLHFLFRHPGGPVPNAIKARNRFDVRGDGGYIVAPPSMVNEHTYHWLPGFELCGPDDLPVFNRDWLPEFRKPEREIDENDPLRRISRARAYVAKIGGAVSGQGGSNATFRVACKLIQEFRLTIDQAWPILLEYNERCVPPWSEKDLKHKLEDACSKSRI